MHVSAYVQSIPSGLDELSKSGKSAEVHLGVQPPSQTETMCAHFPFPLFPVVASVFCLPSSCFSEWYGLVSAVPNHLQIDLCSASFPGNRLPF